MSKRIVIMAGGTGGHVFPALAVAQEMARQGWEVSWLGTRKGLEAKVVPANGIAIAIDWLSVAGLRGKGLLSKITAVFKLLQACGQALVILKRRKPQVVLGMGGFVAGPGGLMAKLLGIPLVIHEQNRIPGTTNRLLAKFATRVLEAFPNSFPKTAKAECTGNPLRQAFLQTSSMVTTMTAAPKLKVFVVGGSLGAQILNETVPAAMALVKDVVVRHQTGAAMLDEVTAQYRDLGVEAEAAAFIEDMVAAYQWADLVVCRAGAMTVSELAAMGKPSILVPFPFAIDDHQTANARYLADAGAGLLVPQTELSAEILAQKINEAGQHLSAMAAAAQACARLQATAEVAAICAEEAK